jgi:hypothetical protein
MDFIIKSMQLSIKKIIIAQQQRNDLPSHAANFVILTNMFNAVSCRELFDIINKDFPELSGLTHLLYADSGDVFFKRNQVSWKTLQMKEGINQGCPLSLIFATLVLDRVLKPLEEQLHQRAAARLTNGIPGDNSFSSLAHIFAYMDDISLTVALEDVQFFCEEIDKLGTPWGCFINPLKTRILTSSDGHSILPQLHKDNPDLDSEIKRTISTYSITYNKTTNKTLPVKLVDGFRLLGTPIGSHSFAHEYYNKQISAVTTALNNLTKNITDRHTCLKLFAICTI